MLKNLFKDALKREGMDFDYNYCWNSFTSR